MKQKQKETNVQVRLGPSRKLLNLVMANQS